MEKVIKDFLTQMTTQKNRYTAAPYFYVIRDKKEIPAPLENCEETRWYDPDSSLSFKDTNDARKFCKENGIEFKESLFEEYGVSYIFTEHGMFLTETDAENHLRANCYHYTSEAHTYLKHAWRAPELTNFFKSLFEYFDIPKGNWDL